MSLQPGPQDPNDESSLTPAGSPPDASQDAPAPEPTEQLGSPPAPDAGWPTEPSAPAAGSPAEWSSPPPPPPAPAPTGYPDPAAAASPSTGAPPMGGQGYAPPPPVDGWAASSPPPAGYAPPPAGVYPGAPQNYPPAGYPPAGYPPQGYQAAGYPAARQTDSKAVVALILAISSWIVCPVITAIIALVLAGQSNRAIDASGGQLEGRSMNTATKVIAWINIVLSVLALIGFVIALVFFANADPSVINDLTEPSTQF